MYLSIYLSMYLQSGSRTRWSRILPGEQHPARVILGVRVGSKVPSDRLGGFHSWLGVSPWLVGWCERESPIVRNGWWFVRGTTVTMETRMHQPISVLFLTINLALEKGHLISTAVDAWLHPWASWLLLVGCLCTDTLHRTVEHLDIDFQDTGWQFGWWWK